ncbi:presenilin family intramembrane aspartyl protease [Chloroflexota bacterium]
MEKKPGFHPFLGSGLLLVASQVLAFFLAFQERDFLESSQIAPPEISVELPLIYFFVAAAALGVVLLVVPRTALRMVLKVLFLFLFAWGTFVALGFSLPVPAAATIAVTVALLWLFVRRIWLHNLLMVITLASVGTVFGVLLAPWTAVLFMLVISVYDILAVRFGYMMWMVRRLSVSDTLPAFIIPKTIVGWNLDLKEARLFEDSSEREFSVLGGGDVGFPLLLIVSVFFAHSFAGSLVVAGFALLGLAAAYWVQRKVMGGKPTPALPPISLLSIVGFLIVYLT